MLTTLLPLSAASSAPSLARSNASTHFNHALVTSVTQPFESLTMKATSTITQRPSRNPHYSKAKRPSMASSHGSPSGIGKSRSLSSVHTTVPRRTPSNSSSIDILKRQRTIQLNGLSRDIRKLLEEEYREDVMEYMLDMEVSILVARSENR